MPLLLLTLSLQYEAAKGSAIEVIAQNMHFAENGAYTGEISAEMLNAIGVKTTILGHSERRAYFNETDESLAKKSRYRPKTQYACSILYR